VTPDQRARIEAATGRAVLSSTPLAGGCIAEVSKVVLDGAEPVVVKAAGPDGTLDIEAYMLRYLAEHSALPVPLVIEATHDLLVMSFIPGAGGIDAGAQKHAAELIAALHEVTGPHFGLERHTLIGPLHQPNDPSDCWVDFFRDRRLLYLGRLAHDAGRLSDGTLRRLERLCAELEDWIQEPAAPSLLHGDLWGGNVLADRGRIAGFVDPAIYYGHPEVELAFSTLFSTFGEPFFRRYRELRPLAPDFFEVRRDLYNLYPLLVHTHLFGGGYARSVDGILRRFVG